MADEQAELTTWQRMGIRGCAARRAAARGEPLEPEDWEIAWHLHETGAGRSRAGRSGALPSSPRCGGLRRAVRGAGPPHRRARSATGRRARTRRSAAICVEYSPPGGMTMHTGVLFADLRGFTARFDGADPREASLLLRRFYRCAEDVLFPDAVIDKLIGDEVMALYLPDLKPRIERERRARADARARPRRCCARSATARRARRSSSWASASTSARPSSATSASARSTTSPRSATSSTPPRGCRAQAAGGEIVLSERVARGPARAAGRARRAGAQGQGRAAGRLPRDASRRRRAARRGPRRAPWSP